MMMKSFFGMVLHHKEDKSFFFSGVAYELNKMASE